MNWKNLTSEELDSTFSDIHFIVPPFYHQLVTFFWVLSSGFNKIFLFHDIGLGKTYTALILLKLWDVRGRVLIVVPNSVLLTWIKEINEKTSFSYALLTGSINERRIVLERAGTGLYLINYEGLKVLWGKKEINGYTVNKQVLDKAGFECIISDECHRYKDPFSLQSRIVYNLNKRSRYSIFMTGTPLAKGAIDFFGECMVLDGGLSFGKSYNYFLNHFFYKRFERDFIWTPKRVCHICNNLYSMKKEHLKSHNVSLETYRKQYPFPEKTSEDLITEKVREFSISFTRDECFDLSEKIYEERSVYPTDEQITWTEDIIAGMKIEEIEKNIEYHITKLMQITGGSIIHDDTIHVFPKNPKLDELLNILQELEGNTIIYHYYLKEADLIRFQLARKGYKVSMINGKVTNREKQLENFGKKNNILIAHPKTGGEGLNLQVAQNVIFYSNGFIGTILREQCEGRIHRVGQKNVCLFIDIVMEFTMDRIMINSLKNRTDIIKEIIEYILKNKKRE